MRANLKKLNCHRFSFVHFRYTPREPEILDLTVLCWRGSLTIVCERSVIDRYFYGTTIGRTRPFWHFCRRLAPITADCKDLLSSSFSHALLLLIGNVLFYCLIS